MIGAEGCQGCPHRWCGILNGAARTRIHEGDGATPLLHRGRLSAIPRQRQAERFRRAMGAHQRGKPVLEGWALAGGGGKGRCRGEELPFKAQERAAHRQGKDGETGDHPAGQVKPKKRRTQGSFQRGLILVLDRKDYHLQMDFPSDFA